MRKDHTEKAINKRNAHARTREKKKAKSGGRKVKNAHCPKKITI